MEYRRAGRGDAVAIGQLHAANWLEEYDGRLPAADVAEVVAGRIAVWQHRLDPAADPRPAVTYVAVRPDDGSVRGFVHAVADHDPRWGSLLGELHVHAGARRTGIGRHLFVAAAGWLATNATSDALYLLVRSENVAARHLYSSLGGRLDPSAESATSSAGLRYYWKGLSALSG